MCVRVWPIQMGNSQMNMDTPKKKEDSHTNTYINAYLHVRLSVWECVCMH